MGTAEELLQVRKDIWAKKRELRALVRKESALVVDGAACPICRAPVGMPCKKPGGGPRVPHRQRQELV